MMLRIVSMLLTLLVVLPRDASACAVCFGATDSAQGMALQGAIITLLGVTLAMLSGIALFAFRVWRHESTMSTPKDDGDLTHG